MKIRDIFKEQYKGFGVEKEGKAEPYKAYLIDSKDVENCNINFSESNLKDVTMTYKESHFLKPGDIIVSTRISSSSCHVGLLTNYPVTCEVKRIIPKKNFIVLSGCNLDLFDPAFVANYLEYIGINKFFEDKGKDVAISLEDVKDIEIPKVSLDNQKDLTELLNPINKRAFLYNRMIKNDIEISKFALNKVISNEK